MKITNVESTKPMKKLPTCFSKVKTHNFFKKDSNIEMGKISGLIFKKKKRLVGL